jgi:hypothetical protein
LRDGNREVSEEDNAAAAQSFRHGRDDAGWLHRRSLMRPLAQASTQTLVLKTVRDLDDGPQGALFYYVQVTKAVMT